VIRLERDPAFWTKVASHPAVAATLYSLPPERIGELAAREDMTPLAATHGGFLFARLDVMGFVVELHTLFTPEGWGREAMSAAREAAEYMFGGRCAMINTFEVRANPRSRPPRRFGFAAAGGWTPSPIGELRLWTLTKAAFEAAPARRLPCQP
jgi:hypothetical protein